jgi:hypothetical protein
MKLTLKANKQFLAFQVKGWKRVGNRISRKEAVILEPDAHVDTSGLCVKDVHSLDEAVNNSIV